MNRSYNMNIDTGEKTWLTPRYIIDALGPFDLDPCCPPKMPWQTAAEMVCRPADGLAVDWRGKRVWLNPPYGREAVPFLRKMAIDGTGGVSPSSSRAPIPPRGRIIFSRSPTASYFFADGSASAAPTERQQTAQARPLRSSRTPRGTLPVCARAGL